MMRSNFKVWFLIMFVLLGVGVVGEASNAEQFTISFSTNEDYDITEYGTDQGLTEVEKDFRLIRELGVYKLRVSFSWCNYEPLKGRFANLEWLHRFVELAGKYDLILMPYLCYAPSWVGENGQWNDRPKDLQDWYNYVYRMVSEFKDTIFYWELWNEEDIRMWFNGQLEDYAELMKVGAQAVKEANPQAQILAGGLTWPNDAWVEFFVRNGYGDFFDILPIHSYAESWSAQPVENYLNPWGSEFDYIANLLEKESRGQPIWINEIGYPTIGSKTELDQASFIRRAVATLLATERISLISWYEIKDFRQDSDLGVIGDSNNYHLGLTYTDRKKKLGFYTYQTLVQLFNNQTLTYLGPQITYTEVNSLSEQVQRIPLHAFRREADGHIILFVWLYGPARECEITLTLPGTVRSMVEYSFDGTETDYNGFLNDCIPNLKLRRDQARLFEIIMR